MLARNFYHVVINADRTDRWHGRIGRIGTNRLRTERAHFAGRIRALQRREVHHADGSIDRPRLGRGLDAPRRQHCCSSFRADLVYWWQRLKKVL